MRQTNAARRIATEAKERWLESPMYLETLFQLDFGNWKLKSVQCAQVVKNGVLTFARIDRNGQVIWLTDFEFCGLVTDWVVDCSKDHLKQLDRSIENYCNLKSRGRDALEIRSSYATKKQTGWPLGVAP